MDVEKLVFIDETWTSTNMTRRYGRAPRGKRCTASAPHGHWQTTTFVGALRRRRLTAPMVTDGPIDGEIFLAYVIKFLCPTLQGAPTAEVASAQQCRLYRLVFATRISRNNTCNDYCG